MGPKNSKARLSESPGRSDLYLTQAGPGRKEPPGWLTYTSPKRHPEGFSPGWLLHSTPKTETEDRQGVAQRSDPRRPGGGRPGDGGARLGRRLGADGRSVAPAQARGRFWGRFWGREKGG